MTDSQIATALQKLPRSQWDMLQACAQGCYKPGSKMAWRSLDALVRKGLLMPVWNQLDYDLYYQAPPQVRLAAQEHPEYRR